VEASRTLFVSVYFPSNYFSGFLMTSLDLGLKMMPQRESSFPPEWLQTRQFPNKAPRSGHSDVQERSRVLELLPNSIPEPKKRL